MKRLLLSLLLLGFGLSNVTIFPTEDSQSAASTTSENKAKIAVFAGLAGFIALPFAITAPGAIGIIKRIAMGSGRPVLASEIAYLAYTGAVLVGLSTLIVKGYPKKCWDYIKNSYNSTSTTAEQSAPASSWDTTKKVALISSMAAVSAALIYLTYKVGSYELKEYQNYIDAKSIIRGTLGQTVDPALLETKDLFFTETVMGDPMVKSLTGHDTALIRKSIALSDIFRSKEELIHSILRYVQRDHLSANFRWGAHAIGQNFEKITQIFEDAIKKCDSTAVETVKNGFSNKVGYVFSAALLSCVSTATSMYNFAKGALWGNSTES